MLYASIAAIILFIIIAKVMHVDEVRQKDFQDAIAKQAKAEIENNRRKSGIIGGSECYIYSDYESVRNKLKILSERQTEIRSYLMRCIDDLDLAMSFDNQLTELKNSGYEPSVFDDIGEALEEVQNSIIHNAKDILSLSYDNRFGKKVFFEQYEIDHIEYVLLDNERRIEKFEHLLQEIITSLNHPIKEK